MKQFIKDYFSFNRRERNGLILLLGIIIILVFYLNWSTYFVPTQKVDFSEFEKEIDEFIAIQQAHPPLPSLSDGENLPTGTPSVSRRDYEELFAFDPNILSEEEWRKLGLKNWQIKAIGKYRSKAGDFYYKEDFKKLHVISDKLYQNLEPYIQLPERGWIYKVQLTTSNTKIPIKPGNFNGLQGVSEYMENGVYKYTMGNEKEFEAVIEIREQAKAKGFKNAFVLKFHDGKRIAQNQSTNETLKKKKSRWPASSRFNKSKIEINAADTFELKKLNGIGSVYAKGITQYRKLLGGFFKKEQLLEVYGIDASVYEPISEFIEVDTSKIRKLNINFCSIYQLQQHPYIIRSVANTIVNYRDRHGKYTSLDDIRKTDLVNDVLYLKIAPYLTIE